MKNRIKKIVEFTVEDYYNSGKWTDDTQDELVAWLCDELMKDKDIEDLYTYEISMKALSMIGGIDIVDLEFIHEIVLKDYV